MMPSRGLLRHLKRSYATVADIKAQAQAHLASVDARNGVSVSPFLTDTYGRGHNYLRISLTERCNLRCTYCMPEDGIELTPKQDLLTNDEVVRLARLFALHGVTKIRLTGGEPTLRKDLPSLLGRLSDFGTLESIGMTSNGIALARKLPELVRAGLTGVNISLDTLDPFKFEFLTRRRGHAAVLTALETAIYLLPPRGTEAVSGQHLASVKINVVVIRGINDAEVTDFAALAKDKPVEIRFIEYMPFDDNAWSTSKMVSSDALLANLRSSEPALAPLPGHTSDTARSYSAPNWRGSVGFISSMTDHFCGGCSRLRLNADGGFKVCLFGPPKVNFRPLLRSGASDGDLLAVIGEALKGKKFAHNGNSSPSEIVKNRNAPMKSAALLSSLGLVSTRPPFSARASSTSLTHLDPQSGRPKMVDVGEKAVTKRSARAVGSVWLNDEAVVILASSQVSKKGDPLAVAQLAGIMAAKHASALIPLCHPVIIDSIDVKLDLDELQKRVKVQAVVNCEGKTGVEMEALTAVSAACLTVWDMLKAVAGKDMRIGDVMVVQKSGGRSGDWQREVPT